MPLNRILIFITLIFVSQVSNAACTINSPPLSFGFYNPQQASHNTSTSTINVLCDVITPFTITLSGGNSGANINRYLSNIDNNKLYYNVYLDNLYSQIWGDGAGGTSVISNSGTNFNQIVYGKIPMQQNIAQGAYSDVPVINVIY